jgi:hypothetical protein
MNKRFCSFRYCMASMLIAGIWMTSGCGSSHPKPYGIEGQLFLPSSRTQVWAVAPTLNISGQSHVDPLLQSDLVFAELQQVHGLTVIPVNRVAEVYIAMRIDRVQTEDQAQQVCQALGCDALVVPTVTLYDSYDPPKLGASLQLFSRPGALRQDPPIDPHELERSASPMPELAMARPQSIVQVVGVYDAVDGTVQSRIASYAAGRVDPNGPLGAREVELDMDRYCGFVYHDLISRLLAEIEIR